MGKYDFIKIKKNFPNIWMRPDLSIQWGLCTLVLRLPWFMIMIWRMHRLQVLLHDSAKCIPNKRTEAVQPA